MIINEKKYAYNDLTIVPAIVSNISSRSECNPYIEDTNTLPIFTAPMASVVNESNLEQFYNNGIIPVLPRNIDLSIRKTNMINGVWVALSLREFEDIFINNASQLYAGSQYQYNIIVDIANGHMKSLYEKCIRAKYLSIANGYKLTIMTGNIANPQTYKYICTKVRYLNDEIHEYLPAIDYIRVGIGGGCGCITSSNVSTHYPQASLIDECKKIKTQLDNEMDRITSYESEKTYKVLPKIVADGGIRNYDHVIKALALGADYVMIGSLFAQCIESSGIKYNKEINSKCGLRLPIERYCNFRYDDNGNWWGNYTNEFITNNLESWKKELDEVETRVGNMHSEYFEALHKFNDRKDDLTKEKFIGHIDVKFFGMASADGQKSISGEKTKTAEGITKYLPVKYILKGWVENMCSYLRSAMSYTNCKTLKEFIGKPTLVVNSISEIQVVNK